MAAKTVAATMRGLVLDPAAPHGVRLAADLPLPRPSPGEALIRVLRAGVCGTDVEMARNGYKDGLLRGCLGHEFVGRVVEVADPSPNASASSPATSSPPSPSAWDWVGKRVVGEINVPTCRGTCPACAPTPFFDAFAARNHCEKRQVLGIMGHRSGAFAEYLALPLANLHVVPDALTDAQATFTEPLAAAFRIVEQLPEIATSDNCNEGDAKRHRKAEEEGNAPPPPPPALRKIAVIGDGKLGLMCVQVLREVSKHRYAIYLVGRHADRAKDVVHAEAAPLIGASEITFVEETQAVSALAKSCAYVVDATGNPAGLELAIALVQSLGTVVLKSTCGEHDKSSGARDALSLHARNEIVVREICVRGSRCGPFDRALRALATKSVVVDKLLHRTFSLAEAGTALATAMSEKGMLKVQIVMP